MRLVYLDYNSTTPMDSRVHAKMQPFFELSFGNPASQSHAKGWQAASEVEVAREEVALLLNCEPQEITFTNGATESNNWAIKGLVQALQSENPSEKIHVLTTSIEHASVSEPLKYLEKKGWIELTEVPVDSLGMIQTAALEKLKKSNTRFLCVIWCQNEIGTIQNMNEICQWAEQNNIVVLSDATQAVGKLPVDLKVTPVSMLSFSGHKIYGPKGSGVLFTRLRHPKILLEPLLHGGGQEKLGRSGTLNVPGIVGLGEACKLARLQKAQDFETAMKWDQFLQSTLKKEFPNKIQFNGNLAQKSPYVLSVTLDQIQSFQLLPKIQNLCVSSGSACGSGSMKASPILMAIGHDQNDLSMTLRISHGRMTTEVDVNEAVETLVKSLKSLDF
jgi:cysteine desulfurase